MGLARKVAGKIVRRSRVAMFGNARPVTVNLLHKAYHAKARNASTMQANALAEPYVTSAGKFAREGYLLFPASDNVPEFGALARRAGELLDDPEVTVRRENEGIIRLKHSFDRFPGLIGLITDHMEKTIEAYYQSHFKIYSTDIYRLASLDRPLEDSFLWHCDNAPKEMIKLLVYLSDTTEATGAFRLKDRAVSDQLKRRGFWDRLENDRFADVLENAASTRILEGAAGTGILFQNSVCVHKATLPNQGERDIAAFLITPSVMPWRDHLAQHGDRLSRNYGICLNPYTDKAERIGDE